MSKAYSAQQIQDFEKSIFIDPGDDLKLMKKAAKDSVSWLIKKFPQHSFIVLCGPGNNGGDGFYIALELKRLRLKVALIDVLSDKKKSNLCAQACIDASGLNFITCTLTFWPIDKVSEG